MGASSFSPRVLSRWLQHPQSSPPTMRKPAKAAKADKVERLALPDGNDFRFSSAVTVKAGVDTYFLSGALAP